MCCVAIHPRNRLYIITTHTHVIHIKTRARVLKTQIKTLKRIYTQQINKQQYTGAYHETHFKKYL